MVVPGPSSTHGYPELVFRAPEGWQERTVLSFALARDGGPATTVMVRRIECFDITGHAARELMKQGKTLPGFELVDARPRMVAGRNAVEHVVAWTANEGRVEQRIVHVEGDPATAYVLVCTCAEADAPWVAASFDELLATFRIRGELDGARAVAR